VTLTHHLSYWRGEMSHMTRFLPQMGQVKTKDEDHAKESL
jgi:hypothetical protein